MNKTILIMGSRGYQKKYGGWETLVDNLIVRWKNPSFTFVVFEVTNVKKEDKSIIYKNGIKCIQIYAKKFGQFTMVLFSIKALLYSFIFISENKIKSPIFLVLGYRIGFLFFLLKSKLNSLKAKIIINPDGIEWTRAKYNFFAKTYLRSSEYFMLTSSNDIVCDSLEILSYVKKHFPSKEKDALYISYGADSNYIDDTKNSFTFLNSLSLEKQQYYLIVGRFIPENNFELMLKEFMLSKTTKKLAIVTNFEKNSFYKYLKNKLHYELDKRIIMIGPVYDKEKLSILRFNAFAYIHGHSAGGTNPSLLEAMSLTSLNILFDVPYNREVGLNHVYYFDKKIKLSNTIANIELLDNKSILSLAERSKKRIIDDYSWDKVVTGYENLFNKYL
jgi:rhamnosyltransferase